MAKKKTKEPDWLGVNPSDNAVWAGLKSTGRNYRKMFSGSGIPMDMGVAARNAGSLAAPTFARAAGGNAKLTNVGIAGANKRARSKVGTELTKSMVWQLGMPVGPIRAARMATGAVKANKVAKAASATTRATPKMARTASKPTASVAAKKTGGATKATTKKTVSQSSAKPARRVRTAASY